MTGSCYRILYLGLGKLAQRGLTYDLLIHPRHLPHVIELVDSMIDVRFVVDHLAKPNIGGGKWNLGRRTSAKSHGGPTYFASCRGW
ncbi:MAG: hypothetical protein H0W86_10970 [Armatimonadetes bacterium]|nr:hypothetical protein [Armatimonadota bacterium]